MSYLLSLDPGLRKCGAALWLDGRLVLARLLVAESAPDDEAADAAGAVEAMSSVVCRWVAERAFGGHMPTHAAALRLCCERPRTYGGRSSRGDANDLVSLALVAGAVMGRLGCPTSLPLPEEWKGGVPKPQSRSEYLRDGYPVEERARLKLAGPWGELARVEVTKDWRKNMDVWDAVGIGLWSLNRK